MMAMDNVRPKIAIGHCRKHRNAHAPKAFGAFTGLGRKNRDAVTGSGKSGCNSHVTTSCTRSGGQEDVGDQDTHL